ncbi:hypothetical protein Ahy_B06g083450 [Arachis hypogaea]|uniref:Transposase, Ptta/En/Spm, plant n=1 Tax=Arachis hypogaea TaxID=3818 RepID=A0A444YPY3_ARAHY|nr:hypothetical protein Ahy_B06g083450 [Arachis hypogaea]
MDPKANEVDLFDEHIDRMFIASDAEKHKGLKTTEFWDVDLIDSDGIVKHAKMSVREDMKRSLNGRKIILRSAGSYYSKFPICEKSWAKVQGKDRVYDDCIKEMFHFQEDSGGRIKKTFLQQMERSWKDTSGRLYDSHYKPTLTLEQNLNNRPEKIPREHWRWFIDYRNDPATKAKCKQNVLNQKKQLYMHISGSKSLARAREQEKKISKIEQLDETTRISSENDSLAQALRKERSGRVRGIGFGPIPSQLFHLSAQLPVDRAQTEEAQRMLFELQAEAVEDKVAAENLKRKAMEDEIAAEKTKRQALESVLSYIVQQQGGQLPPDIAARMNSLDGHGGK